MLHFLDFCHGHKSATRAVRKDIDSRQALPLNKDIMNMAHLMSRKTKQNNQNNIH